MFYITFSYQVKKYKLHKLKNSELKKLDNLLTSLSFASNKNYNNFFEKLLNAKHIKNYIFQHQNSYFYINTKTELNATDFLSANNFYQSTSKRIPLCFISSKFSDDFNKLLNLSPIKYYSYNANELLPILRTSDFFVKKLEQPTTQKIKSKIKSKLPQVLARTNFKNFFFSGLSLITFSIFIPYSIYYMICGTFLLGLSLACLFSKKQISNPNNKTNLSELIKN